MSARPVNPFLPTRFEKHDHPLIWVSDRVRQLEQSECVYVCGTRGSGKTSLLKALHWSERLGNESLRDQVGEAFPAFVGVYFRIPDFLSQALGRVDWRAVFPAAPDPEELAFDFFANFVELLCLEQISEAMMGLRDQGVFNYDPRLEAELIRVVREEQEILQTGGSKTIPRQLSFDWLRLHCRAMHTTMTKAANRGQLPDLLKTLQLGKGGALLPSVTGRIRAMVARTDAERGSTLSFKICVDDCEALVVPQQMFMNTLVRRAKHPVFWVLSFVDKHYEATATLIRNQDLTDADRKIVVIDSLPRQEFRQLCERVSNLRLAYAEPDGVQAGPAAFNLETVLGPTRVNDMLLSGANRRAGKEFWDLVERAKTSGLAQALSPSRSGDHKVGETPIYQQYLVEKLFPGQKASDIIRHQGAALGPMLRRKQVAAFLAMRSEYRLQRRGYAGWEAVVGMSDGCIRDFLEIMAEMFEIGSADGEHALRRFADRKAPLSIDKQRDALEEASKKKASGYTGVLESNAVRAARLVEALGSLTRILQSDHGDPAVLRTPERGIFVFAVDEAHGPGLSAAEGRRLVEDTLLRLEMDGLLVEPKARADESHVGPAVNVNLRRFRLHARFAASYGFSYRGAYEEVRLPMSRVLHLCRRPEAVSPDHWAEEVARLVTGNLENQERLAL